MAKLREKLRNEEQRSEELEEENRDAQQTAEQARQASEAAYAQYASTPLHCPVTCTPPWLLPTAAHVVQREVLTLKRRIRCPRNL